MNVLADPLAGENAAKVNFKVMACSEDSYCCSYPDGYYPLDMPTFDCCDDPERNFTAGAAIFQAGYPVTTKVFVGFTSLSGSRADPSSPKSSTSSYSTWTKSDTQTLQSSMLESQVDTGILSTIAATSQTSKPSTPSNLYTTFTSSGSSSTDVARLTEDTNASAISGLSTPMTSSRDAQSGLSTGAAAGIGVGAGIAVLALVGFGVFAGLRLRNRHSTAHNSMSKELAGSPSIEQQERQLACSHSDSKDIKGSIGIHEAGWQLPSEIDSVPCGELEGDNVGFRH